MFSINKIFSVNIRNKFCKLDMNLTYDMSCVCARARVCVCARACVCFCFVFCFCILLCFCFALFFALAGDDSYILFFLIRNCDHIL